MNTMHLMGSEDVARAGRAIDGAADSMQRTASNIDGSVQQLDRIVARFEDAVRVYAAAVERLILDGPTP